MRTRLIAVTGSAVITLLLLAASNFAQSNPPLTYLQIIGVRSQFSTAWEIIADWQTSTFVNHGGAWLEVKTKEIGYSANWARLFTFNGRTIRMIREEPIPSGSKIIGWYRIWRVEGSFTSGRASYSARSLTSRAYNDSLSIR